MMLYKNGFDAVRYISFEEQIYRNQAMYRQAITVGTAEHESTDNSHYVPFVEQFISMVLSCYTVLDNQFAKMNASKVRTVEQIENIIYDSNEPISKAQICDILPHISQTTVEKYLGDLVREGMVEKVGKAQKTKYVKNECKK